MRCLLRVARRGACRDAPRSPSRSLPSSSTRSAVNSTRRCSHSARRARIAVRASLGLANCPGLRRRVPAAERANPPSWVAVPICTARFRARWYPPGAHAPRAWGHPPAAGRPIRTPPAATHSTVRAVRRRACPRAPPSPT